MKIRLVVSDIDGTILLEEREQEKELSELAGLIKEWKVPFTFATGRPAFMVEELQKKLGVCQPMVVCNGAAAYDKTGYVWNEFLDTKKLRPALELADSLGMAVIVTDGTTEMVYRENAYIKAHPGKWNQIYRPGSEEEWKNYRLQKLLIIDPDKPGQVDKIIEKIRAYDSKCQIVRYDDRGIEVMPQGCTKGQGVQRLAAHLGIPMKEILVIGDNKNDLDMFEGAGISAAVQNAVPFLKEQADYVCQNEAVQGVTEAVKKFFIGGR